MEISKKNDRTLTIREVADLLNLSYNTVFAHRLKWGFFQMEGSRVWRVFREDLDHCRKRKNNVIRLVGLTDTKNGGKDRCQSSREAMYIGSTLQHQVANELDEALGLK
ncbi:MULTISPECIES: helix-turn-helix domain-containing protein [Rodentibacter]|uniref:helix-turn-helix domain-containing protein n=1 Tax=Rodentibacter TaxID=1960084 RepID=UPI001CFE5760|nr:helix-turn-helix domain-containing protein [Rodentibacter sp. JRC1]GJI55870.1 hypothetical protein HEMROJRC1_09820 [Rodentibacter sp. JRC1]